MAQKKAHGGPSEYYDFSEINTSQTLNDIIEYLSKFWDREVIFYLANILKAVWRFGRKEGTSKEYDAKKLVYFSCRILKYYVGTERLRLYLQVSILNDKQFKEDKDEN